jgi:inosine-uridine nucleoside N-ribohydrolase
MQGARSNPVKIILDVDPGIDDAVALLLALNSPAVRVLAVTAASGNVNVDKSTRNALRVIESVGRKIPVAKGAGRPLFKQPIHAEHIHGRNGLGGADLPRPRGRAGRKGAVTLIEDLVRTYRKREISLVATAPLTNIALLLRRDHSILRRFAGIFVMGGAFGLSGRIRGNITPHAEFNFYCDPEAADMVLNSGAGIVAAGLDVTMNPRCAVRRDTLQRIGDLGGRTAETAAMLLSYPVRRYRTFHLHDVFALAALLRPGIFRTVRCGVVVNRSGRFRGRCLATPDRRGSVNVCTKVDSKRFRRFLLEGLTERGS